MQLFFLAAFYGKLQIFIETVPRLMELPDISST